MINTFRRCYSPSCGQSGTWVALWPAAAVSVEKCNALSGTMIVLPFPSHLSLLYLTICNVLMMVSALQHMPISMPQALQFQSYIRVNMCLDWKLLFPAWSSNVWQTLRFISPPICLSSALRDPQRQLPHSSANLKPAPSRLQPSFCHAWDCLSVAGTVMRRHRIRAPICYDLESAVAQLQARPSRPNVLERAHLPCMSHVPWQQQCPCSCRKHCLSPR